MSESTVWRFQIPAWVRWLFLSLAVGSAIGTLALGREVPQAMFLFGLVVPICCGAAFIYCAKVNFEISASGLIVGGLFGGRLVSPSQIRRLVERNASRQAKSVTAYDERGARLFCLTDNVRDYETALGLLKEMLLAGAVLETHDGFSVGTRVAPLFGAHRDKEAH